MRELNPKFLLVPPQVMMVEIAGLQEYQHRSAFETAGRFLLSLYLVRQLLINSTRDFLENLWLQRLRTDQT